MAFMGGVGACFQIWFLETSVIFLPRLKAGLLK